MSRIRRIGAFWYDFIVGDDWRVAAAVVLALVVTYGISQLGVPAWWVLPAAVLVVLPLSLRRAVRRKQ